MYAPEFRHRKQVASAIRSFRSVVAEDATNEFLAAHPDWEVRYGERARQFGIEDAGYHQDFLAGAIEAGEVESFNEYGEWATRMLKARNIEPRFVAESFEQIGRALRSRLSAPDAEIVDGFLRSGAERCLRSGGDGGSASVRELSGLTGLYIQAAIGGSRQAALNLLLDALRQGQTVIDLYTEVLQAAMFRIGRLWEDNRITVAQEHMATAITQFAIAQLYPRIEMPQTCRGRVVVTGVEGEFHQVGANMVADVLEASGFDVRFLGTNTPVSGVIEAVEEHNADILGISATMLFNVPHVIRLADAIRGRAGRKIRIVGGGAAFRSAPKLWSDVGASGCALDLRSAVALFHEMEPGDP